VLLSICEYITNFVKRKAEREKNDDGGYGKEENCLDTSGSNPFTIQKQKKGS